MTIKSRLPKIKEASQQAVCSFADYKNKRRYGVRGSDPADVYQVSIEFGKATTFDVGYLTADCTCHKVGSPDMIDCKGNSNGAVCYHSLASLMKGASSKGKTLVLFDTFSDAHRYSNFGGQVVKITSAQGSGVCWGVVK